MQYEGFSVQINEGEEENGYVGLKHGQKYSITLTNSNGVRSDASIVIDGKNIGTFRIDPYSNISIERSTNDRGKFTFFSLGTSGFKQSELQNVDKSKLGLISVTFKQEIRKQYIPTPIIPIMPWPNPWVNPWSDRPLPIPQKKYRHDGQMLFCCSVNVSNEGGMTAGGTGLSGYSSQKFVEVQKLTYDEDSTVQIHLRLFKKFKNPKKKKIRPLQSIKSTRIPEPV